MNGLSIADTAGCPQSPTNWRRYCDEVTDNFRVISPEGFRILA